MGLIGVPMMRGILHLGVISSPPNEQARRKGPAVGMSAGGAEAKNNLASAKIWYALTTCIWTNLQNIGGRSEPDF
jgi:hypothetical protein